MSKKTLVSGVKPTGRPHIGNYFGAMRQFVELQDEHNPYIFVADYHALTTLHDPEKLKQGIIDMVLDYLAIGLDPKKVVLFKQSDVSEHTELAWIFNSITTMPFLMRAHAFKDAEAKNKEISVGTFDYPLLMAADILLYDAEVVPVGQDQKQHVEITRDTAQKFNLLFGETFTLPNPHIIEGVETVPGTDGQKMSKSYNNTIPLFATLEEITQAVMSIPTDSKGVDEPKDISADHVYALHKLFSTHELESITEGYERGGLSYKESKDKLIANINAFIEPLREKRASLEGDLDQVQQILEEGAKKAKEVASKKMEVVRKAIGITM